MCCYSVNREQRQLQIIVALMTSLFWIAKGISWSCLSPQTFIKIYLNGQILYVCQYALLFMILFHRISIIFNNTAHELPTYAVWIFYSSLLIISVTIITGIILGMPYNLTANIFGIIGFSIALCCIMCLVYLFVARLLR